MLRLTSMDTMRQRSAYARKLMEEASPSRWHGIDAAMEQQLRRSYTLFMQRLGKSLRLPQQPTIATATILCHRFFLRQSHAKNDSLLIASACLFLASKSEDTPRRLAHCAAASYNLRFGTRTDPRDAFVLENKGLQKESERLLLLAEHLILCTLGFELEVELPYTPLFAALRMLKENLVMQKELTKLGERRRKSQIEGKAQTAKLDQEFDGRVPMDVENSASKHMNVQHINMDRHVSAAAQNNVSGKLSQPVHTQYFREGETSFHQVAWNFVNDTLLTLMCMQFKPHHIAAGAVWLAGKFLGVKLPSDGERAWWKEMKVTPLELEVVGNQFLEVYSAEEDANCQKGVNPQSVSKLHNL